MREADVFRPVHFYFLLGEVQDQNQKTHSKIMSEFEPIPEEIPRQSRSAQKDGGSSDRKSKSSDKHAVKEKKSRSSKNKEGRSSSKGDSPPSGPGGHGHGRLGSNGSSKSGSKHKSEPLISLTATTEMDMGLPETSNNSHGTVLCFVWLIDLFFLSAVILLLLFFFPIAGWQSDEWRMSQFAQLAQFLLSAPAIILTYSSVSLVLLSFRPSAIIIPLFFFDFVFRFFFYCALFSLSLFGSFLWFCGNSTAMYAIQKQMIVTDVVQHQLF